MGEPKPPQQKISEKAKAFLKSLFDSSDESSAKDLNEVLDDRNRDEVLWQLTSALRESLDSILDDDTVSDKQSASIVVLQQFFDALQGSGLTKAELEKMFAGNEPREDLHKRKEDEKMPKDIPIQIDKSALSPELREHLETIEKQAADAKKQAEEFAKQAQEANDIAKAERDARLTETFINKAAGYRALPVKAEDFGPVLKALAEKAPDEYKILDELLKSVDAAMADSDLFKEIGKGAGGGSNDVMKRVELAAEELRKSEPTLTKEQAFSKALQNNPELYTEYRKNQ
ncbi:hypothetical protein [Tumebacillus permanentifrigoris]|uniref:Uncharacterized protein n=1 Tax=Tumebacillus permanentifrigoris TaxID=378543 RepID=A0A316D5Z4_9BACL|nr:hypothetical protein [Tumebacillus permanentifrigoris]PWK07505.1 hypothetical protein C7459_117104 [Tumebacillus permanentifrigoris]